MLHYIANCLQACKGHTCTLSVTPLHQRAEGERAAGAIAVQLQSRSVAQRSVSAFSLAKGSGFVFIALCLNIQFNACVQ